MMDMKTGLLPITTFVRKAFTIEKGQLHAKQSNINISNMLTFIILYQICTIIKYCAKIQFICKYQSIRKFCIFAKNKRGLLILLLTFLYYYISTT